MPRYRNPYSWQLERNIEPVECAELATALQALQGNPVAGFIHDEIAKKLGHEMNELLHAVRAQNPHEEAKIVGRIEVLQLLCEEGFGFMAELHKQIETRKG